MLSAAAMDDFCLTRPPGEGVLPSLRSIKFFEIEPTRLRRCLPLISPSVTHISIRWENQNPKVWDISDYIFAALAHRTPALRSLSIIAPDTTAHLPDQRGLKKWLNTCSELQNFWCEPHHQSAPVCEALASLPSLSSWELATTNGISQGVIDLSKPGFLNLHTLAFKFSKNNVRTFFRGCPLLASVTGFGATYEDYDTADDVRYLTAQISFCLPQLSCLILSLARTSGTVQPAADQFAFIRPLLSMSSLINLWICYCRPIKLSDSEVAEMGEAWPQMEELHVSEDAPHPVGMPPVDHTSPMLLQSFAEAFPNLRELGVPLSPIDDLPADGNLKLPVCFKVLETLDVGISPLPSNPSKISLLLGALCTDEIEILVSDSDGVDEARTSGWERVAEMASMISKAKAKLSSASE